jgi:hypothetical protein
MRNIQLYLLVLIAAFTTGCPKYRPSVDFENVDTFRGRLNRHLRNEQIKYQCYRDGKDYDDSTDPPKCTGASGSVADGPARAKQVRNDLINDALSYIDDSYGDFKNGLAAGRDRTNFVADLIDLSTSAAVGITNGERPLQILGVALTAFRGGRRSADANFYKDQSTPILISKMNGNRARVRSLILENEKKDIDGYGIGTGVSDIVDYYNAGTLVDAFTELAGDTASDTKKAQEDLRELKRQAGIRPAPTEAEIKLSRENADAIDALVNAYVDAEDKAGAADTKVGNAETAVNTATKASEAAAQRVADATQRIAAATTDAARKQAQADKSAAEADKAKADADKNKAVEEKKQADAEKAAAVNSRDTSLANLRGAYSAIEGDPALGPLLLKIPDSDPGYSDQFKATLRAQLKRVKENKTSPPSDKPTAEDYASILLKVGKIVRENFANDPTLNDRLQKILKVNK